MLDTVTLLTYNQVMKTRYVIPTAKELHSLFEYRNGKLFWKVDTQFGKRRKGTRAGYLAGDGYRKIGIGNTSYMEHRLIWRMHHPKGRMPLVLDHIDCNKSNNRIENLRVATFSMNILNRLTKTKKKVKIRKDNRLLILNV